MTQSVVIQVGQCGNQIGCRFWDLALREHSSQNRKGLFDDSLSSFFRNVDTRYSNPREIPVGDGTHKISSLKARAVLVDMEEGVVNELLRGPLGELFDCRQQITSVSGSGNNWAVGYKTYGHMYGEQIEDCIRRTAEACDCLQSFFLLHSMGGGTGSGLGTFVLDHLKDCYPEVFRFCVPVYPSADDDVITSPYNSMLATYHLTETSDCVLPVDNQSLSDICQQVAKSCFTGAPSMRRLSRFSLGRAQTAVTSAAGAVGGEEKPFDEMNNIVANLLLNLTSSSRFEGSLNVDLNEISMNLVPFPRLHYLVSSMAPHCTLADVGMLPRKLDHIFSDVFARDHQLMHADPKNGLYLCCALLLRGDVQMSDIRRNIERLRPGLRFVRWNEDGWKTGICGAPPAGQPYSLLCLANNTCIQHTFTDLQQRFMRLFRRRAHLHHYTSVEGMDREDFTRSLESLQSIVAEYRELETTSQMQTSANLTV